MDATQTVSHIVHVHNSVEPGTCSHDQDNPVDRVEVDYSDPFLTRHNLNLNQVTSMLSSLNISDHEHSDDDVAENSYAMLVCCTLICRRLMQIFWPLVKKYKPLSMISNSLF